MRLRFATGLLIALTFTAGCLTAVGPAPGPAIGDWEGAGGAAQLPCEASAVQDGVTSDNLRDLASLKFELSPPPGTGVPSNRHGEVDANGDWLLAMRADEGGFEVANIADPLKPVHATRYDTGTRETAHDVKWMPDGRSAVVGMDERVVLVDLTEVLDSDVPPGEMFDSDVLPVEVTEWNHPLVQPLVTNMHMLATARIGGEDYVFIAPNDNVGIMAIKLVGSGDDRRFDTVGVIGLPLTGGPIGPHDMSIVHDEFLDAPVLYIANGFEGWMAFDVRDPAQPKLLALVPNAEAGYTHTAIGQIVGARRIVVTISELGVNVMKIFDATNFQAPILLATWSAKATDPSPPLHNFQIVDGRLYMAHYVHGFFIFDLRQLGDLPVTGTLAFEPVAHWQQPERQSGLINPFVDIWDVVVHRGLLYASDIDSGLYVVEYGCLRPGDKDATSHN